MLLGDTLRSMVQYRLRWDQIFEQMYFIGIRSQVVVLTTGAFTGAVFAAQVWFQFKRFGMESAIGPTVAEVMNTFAAQSRTMYSTSLVVSLDEMQV